jgi:ubiquinone biosynthesis protein UbiJ
MLAAVLNRLLAHSLDVRSQLATQAGRTLRIETPLKNETLVVMPDGRLAHSAAAPEATLILPLSFFIARTHAAEAAAQQVERHGDPAFAGELAQTLSQLRWDAAETLSDLLGDILAHRLLRLAGRFGGVPGAIGGRLLKTYVEYLRAESALLADPAEVAHWRADVEALAHDLVALEVRVQQIK